MRVLTRRRGILLVLVLMLVACLFVMCAGFLATKNQEAKSAHLAREAFQARELAFTGLEIARERLLNDNNFPPASMGPDQEVFEVSEAVRNFDNTDDVGRYQLHCDRRWIDYPFYVLRVTSVGQVGDSSSNPTRHRLVGEFLTSDGNKGKMINFVDLGAF